MCGSSADNCRRRRLFNGTPHWHLHPLCRWCRRFGSLCPSHQRRCHSNQFDYLCRRQNPGRSPAKKSQHRAQAQGHQQTHPRPQTPSPMPQSGSNQQRSHRRHQRRGHPLSPLQRCHPLRNLFRHQSPIHLHSTGKRRK